MSDPAELRVALAEFEVWEVDGSWDSYPAVVGSDINDARIIIAAARERLAQLESGSIVIVRDAEGNWPAAVLETVAVVLYNSQVESPRVSWNQRDNLERNFWIRRAGFIFDTLADSSKAPE